MTAEFRRALHNGLLLILQLNLLWIATIQTAPQAGALSMRLERMTAIGRTRSRLVRSTIQSETRQARRTTRFSQKRAKTAPRTKARSVRRTQSDPKRRIARKARTRNALGPATAQSREVAAEAEIAVGLEAAPGAGSARGILTAWTDVSGGTPTSVTKTSAVPAERSGLRARIASLRLLPNADAARPALGLGHARDQDPRDIAASCLFLPQAWGFVCICRRPEAEEIAVLPIKSTIYSTCAPHETQLASILEGADYTFSRVDLMCFFYTTIPQQFHSELNCRSIL
mmetsp:Transcript_1138/g.2180  ORF Transcript_1138/g.2180 Transcript_1138/m.2180 type:complete len:285 (+) Transcript_1138:1086-1940(+)